MRTSKVLMPKERGIVTPETFAKNAESIAKLADELAVMFPTLTRAEVERAAIVGVMKARELRERATKKTKKKGASHGE